MRLAKQIRADVMADPVLSNAEIVLKKGRKLSFEVTAVKKGVEKLIFSKLEMGEYVF